ncbi:MAG: ABC-ATPase domain-containing protein [Phycisphaerae bacterium]|jgi:predicted ABC-class ATPase
MNSVDDLRHELARIDGRGYKAYKDIRGAYDFGPFAFFIDHVQADPYAPPSRVRVRLPMQVARVPEELFANRVRRVALQDFLIRQVHAAIRKSVRPGGGTGKGVAMVIDAGRQEVLERTAVLITPEWIEARIQVHLPAAGRRILGRQAVTLLCQNLPAVVDRGLIWSNLAEADARSFVTCVENQEHIRDRLQEMNLVAFVADRSILPRESGASNRPLPEDRAVPFRSPDSLRVELEVPNPIDPPDGNGRSITGLGIPEGVTLIVGGGYHGKSTLLDAVQHGVYPHIPGDGREYVVTRHDTVKIRAEDGRRVEKVDISPFIDNLPYGRSTASFATDDASGSTSQASNILEAIEIGTGVLLVDEDTSATNFMVRDARMQALVHKDCEPITPFLDRVRELHDNLGVSTVLVMGGCGDYFEVADTVIMMRDFLPHDVTNDARKIAASLDSRRSVEPVRPFTGVKPRIPLSDSFDASRGRREVKIDAPAVDTIRFGANTIDLRSVEQLVDLSQTRAVGHAIHLAATRFMDGKRTLADVIHAVQDVLDREGLDVLDPFRRGEQHPGNFARPRAYEIAAAVNRLRSVRMQASSDG